MKLAIDNLKDADEAVEYADMARFGATQTLKELHQILTDVAERTDDTVSARLLERARLLVEAQLNY